MPVHNVHDIAQAVAGELGPEWWAYSCGGTQCRMGAHRAVIGGPDTDHGHGQSLRLWIDGDRLVMRTRIPDELAKYSGGGVTITVAPGRPPAQMAREITRRLLPPNLQAMAEAHERAQADRKLQALLQDRTDQLAAAMGARETHKNRIHLGGYREPVDATTEVLHPSVAPNDLVRFDIDVKWPAALELARALGRIYASHPEKD